MKKTTKCAKLKTVNSWYPRDFVDGKLFVTDSYGKRILYTEDARHWHKLDGEFPLFGVEGSKICSGGGRLVVLEHESRDGKYSDNGYDWHELETHWRRHHVLDLDIIAQHNLDSWSVFFYGGGKFVALSKYSYKGICSDNGEDWDVFWTPIPGGDTFDAALERRGVPTSGCYGAGKFVVVGNEKEGLYSEDCQNWEIFNLPAEISSYGCKAICYGAGKFLLATEQLIFISEDLINWEKYKSPICGIEECKYCDGKFIVTGGNRDYAWSTDGVNWNKLELCGIDTPGYCSSKFFYDAGRHIAINHMISSTGEYAAAFAWISKNGIDWEKFELPEVDVSAFDSWGPSFEGKIGEFEHFFD